MDAARCVLLLGRVVLDAVELDLRHDPQLLEAVSGVLVPGVDGPFALNRLEPLRDSGVVVAWSLAAD